MQIQIVSIQKILTRTNGYLAEVCSHSLQPYRGCSWGRSQCGVYCYVQHNPFVTRGRDWGRFLEVRSNAASAYAEQFAQERAWCRKQNRRFSIFCSSATDPFLPQERRFGITKALLQQMLINPPDELILQTRSRLVADDETLPLLLALQQQCGLRVHLTIEGDRDRLPGLPPPAVSVAARLEVGRRLAAAGINCVVTVSPLFPLRDPDRFFAGLAEFASAVVIDHFIGGDGSVNGARTRKTDFPAAIAALTPQALEISYRDQVVEIARRYFPGRVGVSATGFAGQYA